MNLPIVFLHSLAGSSAHWAAQVAHFRDRHAVAVTLPGHPAGPKIKDCSPDAIAHALKLEKFDRFVLVGHSGGAVVAAAWAKANPARVTALVLADAGPDLSQLPKQEVEGFIKAFGEKYRESTDAHWNKILKGAKPQVHEKVLADLHATPKETVIGFMSVLFEFDLVGALRAYPGPIHSIITPMSEGPGALHDLMPKIQMKRIKGTSHWLHMDKPAEFNRILEEKLKTKN